MMRGKRVEVGLILCVAVATFYLRSQILWPKKSG